MTKFDEWSWKSIKALAILLVLFIALPMTIFWITYTNVTVTNGAKFGFVIGDNKKQAFENIGKLNETIFITFPIDRQGYGPHKILNQSHEDFEILEDRSDWKLYFDRNDYSNVLILSFDKQNTLRTIYRHKQLFELP